MSSNVTKQTTVHLDVTPLDALVDEPVTIRLSGLPPSQTVTLWARSRDMSKNEWVSSAAFVVDSNGEIDLATQQPVAGSYHKVDPMGLFWSMKALYQKSLTLFLTGGPKPVETDLIAEMDSVVVAATRLVRRFAAEGVVSVPVQEQGLVGVFCHPAGSGPWPAVIILSGSDGGIRENQAALLASHGFAALTLAYFGREGLPKNLVHIPLEYFEVAIHWLQAQSTVNGDKIGVIGLSRGGELVLLLGATFPAIKAVVAGSPSGLVHHHPYPDQHLRYKGAGHFVCFPYGYPFLPPFVKRVQSFAVGGGTVEDTAVSVADSWPKILAFFKGSLG